MATLIAVYNSEGCVGRCDAKCHDAHEPQCVCICGGRNHGVGRTKAQENTMAWLVEEAEAMNSPETATFIRKELAAFRARHGLNGDLRVAFGEEAAYQPVLF